MNAVTHPARVQSVAPRTVSRRWLLALVAAMFELPGSLPSVPDLALTNERRERYEKALARLSQGDREAIIARFELGFSGSELAAALHKPTAGATRA
jgi:DNA-directed RNA polymerase specialized sigma24 family protein